MCKFSYHWSELYFAFLSFVSAGLSWILRRGVSRIIVGFLAVDFDWLPSRGTISIRVSGSTSIHYGMITRPIRWNYVISSVDLRESFASAMERWVPLTLPRAVIIFIDSWLLRLTVPCGNCFFDAKVVSLVTLVWCWWRPRVLLERVIWIHEKELLIKFDECILFNDLGF